MVANALNSENKKIKLVLSEMIIRHETSGRGVGSDPFRSRDFYGTPDNTCIEKPKLKKG